MHFAQSLHGTGFNTCCSSGSEERFPEIKQDTGISFYRCVLLTVAASMNLFQSHAEGDGE